MGEHISRTTRARDSSDTAGSWGPSPRSAAAPRACVGALHLVDLIPERAQVEHEPGAAGDTHTALGGAERHCIATVASELVDLEAAELRVDEPVVADPGARVAGELLHAVAPDVAWAGRRDLHDDVGRDA